MKKYYQLILGCLLAVWTVSCTEQLDNVWQDNGKGALVKATFSDFKVNGTSTPLRSENTIKHMQACLFENGVMTKAYSDIKTSGNEYTVKLDHMAGTLYMLANTEQLVDLDQLLASGITEEEWLNTTITAQDGKVKQTFTGALKLDEQEKGKYTFPLMLKRGIARFDVLLKSKNIQVKSVTLKQIIQEGFLLEQPEVASPAKAEATDQVFPFDQPLEQDSLGLAYVYEQLNPDAKVAIEALIDGRSYTLEEPLPTKLKRNAVYTLTIRKERVTEKVRLEIEVWENEDESLAIPDFDSILTIDEANSTLPAESQISENGATLTLPWTACDFTLAVACDEELEFESSLNTLIEVEKVTTTPGNNLFRIKKKLLPPGYPNDTAKIYFRRKGLQHAYEEDHLTLVSQSNPICLEGSLHFEKADYTCDFKRYIDNELGRFIMPEGLELTVECPDNDPWVKIEQDADNRQAYRVIGGWKPNDPNADGREQTATLIVRRTSDKQETERYYVKRRNFGLPVTYLNGIWWCKYNAIGNSKRFEDQILCSQDPARLAGKTVRDYLKDCPQDMYLKLWNAAYGGNSGIAMEAVYKDGKWVLDGWRSNESIHINGLDAKALSPDGYEMPSFENYKQILGYPMTIPLNWDEFSPAIGKDNYRSRIIWETRGGFQMDGNDLGELASFTIESLRGHGSEPLTFYGVGSQWGGDGINANNLLIANYNPTSLEGSFINGNRRLTINGAGANNTRIVRFKKSPVEYIYGTETGTK